MVQWRVHGERVVYESPWVSLALTTVEPPSVAAFEHHVVRARGPAAGCIATRDLVGEASAEPTDDTAVRSLIADGQVTDGLSLTALAVAFTLGVLR